MMAVTGRKRTVRSVGFGSPKRAVWVIADVPPGWPSALPQIPDIGLNLDRMTAYDPKRTLGF